MGIFFTFRELSTSHLKWPSNLNVKYFFSLKIIVFRELSISHLKWPSNLNTRIFTNIIEQGDS
jgi:hypothetical protein